MPNINRGVIAFGIVSKSILESRTKEAIQRLADAVLITRAFALVALLAVGAWCLL
jgi:hypothetical protein